MIVSPRSCELGDGLRPEVAIPSERECAGEIITSVRGLEAKAHRHKEGDGIL